MDVSRHTRHRFVNRGVVKPLDTFINIVTHGISIRAVIVSTLKRVNCGKNWSTCEEKFGSNGSLRLIFTIVKNLTMNVLYIYMCSLSSKIETNRYSRAVFELSWQSVVRTIGKDTHLKIKEKPSVIGVKHKLFAIKRL